jgi:hypothetical protein
MFDWTGRFDQKNQNRTVIRLGSLKGSFNLSDQPKPVEPPGF